VIRVIKEFGEREQEEDGRRRCGESCEPKDNISFDSFVWN